MYSDELEETSDVGTRMRQEMALTQLDLKDVSDLPPALIVTNVPASVFTDQDEKANFAALFRQIDEDIKFEYFRSFKRVRMTFSSPETATTARLYCDHLTFNGQTLKTFFAQKLDMPKSTANNADHYLNVPPLEKQFLISPPASPPVGWEQQREMEPVVCSFDLMARLAAFAVADTVYEVHPGTDHHPAIIVHPADKDEIPDPETPYSGGSRKIPHTPRPPVAPISTSS